MINLIDKVVEFFNPAKGVQRRYARNILSSAHTGASVIRKSLTSWETTSGDSDSDDLPDLQDLRYRSRDLYRNNGHGRGAIRTSVTNVIGTGLTIQSRIDRKFLNLSDEQADEWEANAEREFKLWSESIDCDAGRRMDFLEQQKLVFLSTLMSGDCFTLLPQIDRGNPYDLAIKILEADQVSTPYHLVGNANIKDGIEVDEWGAPKKYYVSKRHPGSPDLRLFDWKPVDAFGERTNRRNILHIMNIERPGQKRGIPFLSPVIETLKQFGRYTEAELMAAVVSGMFTAFVTTPTGDNLQEDSATGRADVAPDISLGNGVSVPLTPGSDIKIANPSRPNSNFEGFANSMLKQVGAALDIPYEILVKQFNASFSASRAALLEAWKFFKTARSWLAKSFCQPVYEEFLTEAIIKGRIVAVGFFNDPAIRKAYIKAEWIGPAKGMIDEVKAVKAAALRVQNGFSTRSMESIQMNGSDIEQNIRQLSKEKKLLEKEGLSTETTDKEEDDDNVDMNGEKIISDEKNLKLA